MISYVEGTVELKEEKFVVVNVSGVGYKIFAGEETLGKIPQKGSFVKLWTHLYVREDAQELYGFLTPEELNFFETLIGIPGIGPKGGLGILGVAPIDMLKKAIGAGDTSYLTRVSGIGRKTAEKIILELKDKMIKMGTAEHAPELKEEADALEALTSLGYSQKEAREALRAVPAEIRSAEKRIKEALRRLGSRK